MILFQFHALLGKSVEILFEDKKLACTRQLKESRFYSSGVNIRKDLGEEFFFLFLQKSPCLGKNTFKEFALKLKETQFVEDDESKNCVNYPNRKYETYNNCDEDFVNSVIPTDLVPIWATNNTENVTRHLFLKSEPNYYVDIIEGTLMSQCQLPCSLMHVESRFLREKRSDHNRSFIILTFSNNVLVTKTYFLKFNFLIFLSDVGGSMGLWLGIGLLQALEIILNCVLNIIKIKQ